MAIQWQVPPTLFSGLTGGNYINETSAGGLEWMTPEGNYVNEQPAAAGGSIVPILDSYRARRAA